MKFLEILNNKSLFIRISFVLSIAGSGRAYAYTDCTGIMKRFYVGTNGELYASLATGMAVFMVPTSNGDRIALTAVSAMSTGRQVTVRVAADGAACTGSHTDWIGIWLEGSP